MTEELYKEIREKNNNDMSLLYQYFLEMGGMKVSAPDFMQNFKVWCMMNFVDVNQNISEIKKRLDNKYNYKTKKDNVQQ